MGRNLAIILAGGIGSRINSNLPKQFIELSGKELLEIALENFIDHKGIDSIYIVIEKKYLKKIEDFVKRKNLTKVKKIIPGGATRQLSSFNGVAESESSIENILIHDAARPFVTGDLISRILNELKYEKAVCPVLDSTDTLVEISIKGDVKTIPDRERIKRVQTPQGFRREIIIRAHKLAYEAGISDLSDDSSLVQNCKISKIVTIRGEETNIKITYATDLELAKKIYLELMNEKKM